MTTTLRAENELLREALIAAKSAIDQIQSEYCLGGLCQELLDTAEELVDAALKEPSHD